MNTRKENVMLTLGIDSSTQGTKAVVYDTAGRCVVASAAVNYGKDLPEFGSRLCAGRTLRCG